MKTVMKVLESMGKMVPSKAMMQIALARIRFLRFSRTNYIILV